MKNERRPLLVAGTLLALLPVAASAVTPSSTHGSKPRLTAAEARQVALRKYPHGHADKKVALENEEGKLQYAVVVHVRQGKKQVMHEVMVGANSGKVEADEVTTPGEEAKEKAAEAKAHSSQTHKKPAGQ